MFPHGVGLRYVDVTNSKKKNCGRRTSRRRHPVVLGRFLAALKIFVGLRVLQTTTRYDNNIDKKYGGVRTKREGKKTVSFNFFF